MLLTGILPRIMSATPERFNTDNLSPLGSSLSLENIEHDESAITPKSSPDKLRLFNKIFLRFLLEAI